MGSESSKTFQTLTVAVGREFPPLYVVRGDGRETTLREARRGKPGIYIFHAIRKPDDKLCWFNTIIKMVESDPERPVSLCITEYYGEKTRFLESHRNNPKKNYHYYCRDEKNKDGFPQAPKWRDVSKDREDWTCDDEGDRHYFTIDGYSSQMNIYLVGSYDIVKHKTLAREFPRCVTDFYYRCLFNMKFPNLQNVHIFYEKIRVSSILSRAESYVLLDGLFCRIKEVTEEVAAKNEELHDAQNQIVEKHDRVTEVTQRNGELQDQLAAVTQMKAELEENLAESQQRVGVVFDESEQRLAEVTRMRNERVAINRDLISLRKQLDEVQNDLNMWKTSRKIFNLGNCANLTANALRSIESLQNVVENLL